MAKVEPFPVHLQRALLYVQLLNAGNYQPSPNEVDVFATEVQPSAPSGDLLKVAGFGGGSLVGQLSGLPVAGDRVAGYMRTVGWPLLFQCQPRRRPSSSSSSKGSGSTPNRLSLDHLAR